MNEHPKALWGLLEGPPSCLSQWDNVSLACFLSRMGFRNRQRAPLQTHPHYASDLALK